MERCSPESERAEQRRWRLLPSHAGLRIFDELLANEFLDPEAITRSQEAALSRLLRFSAAQVPFYRSRFEALKIAPEKESALAALRRLPLLDKQTLQDNERTLCATALPAGDKLFGWFSSSGTTGRPTRVLHTHASNRMFSFLGQRGLRWFRWDPMGLRGDIRVATQFPPGPDGKPTPVGGTVRLPRWRYLGAFFETGEYAGICVTVPLARQLAWLAETRPAYLLAYPSTLERLAHALQAEGAGTGTGTGTGVRGMLAVSEQMTAAMRRRVEASFQVGVAQNYGLNEVGLVAQRCQAGRYHVNIEHCLVELLDDDDQPCRSGEIGRLVVTTLRNTAMPLLRYDTGDLAEAVDGPCACGRSLPSFGAIFGRYRRMAEAPDDTSIQLYVLKAALESMPADLIADLRQYQIRQWRDGSYTILLRIADALQDGFEARLRAAWHGRFGAAAPGLALQVVEEIPLSPSGKVEDFISDFAAPDGR